MFCEKWAQSSLLFLFFCGAKQTRKKASQLGLLKGRQNIRRKDNRGLWASGLAQANSDRPSRSTANELTLCPQVIIILFFFFFKPDRSLPTTMMLPGISHCWGVIDHRVSLKMVGRKEEGELGQGVGEGGGWRNSGSDAATSSSFSLCLFSLLNSTDLSLPSQLEPREI